MTMKKMTVKNILGLAAVAGLMAFAAPAAQAVSLINPGSSVSAKAASEGVATEVRWGRHHGWHRHRGWHRHHGWRHHRRHHWY